MFPTAVESEETTNTAEVLKKSSPKEMDRDMDALIWWELEQHGVICAIPGTSPSRTKFELMAMHAGFANRSDAQLALFLVSGQFTKPSVDMILAEQARRSGVAAGPQLPNFISALLTTFGR
jgi:hypothetical protein